MGIGKEDSSRCPLFYTFILNQAILQDKIHTHSGNIAASATEISAVLISEKHMSVAISSESIRVPIVEWFFVMHCPP